MPVSASLAMFLLIKSVFSEESNHPLVFAMGGMMVALFARMRNEARETLQAESAGRVGSAAQIVELPSPNKRRTRAS
jgi:hypothetical protein